MKTEPVGLDVGCEGDREGEMHIDKTAVWRPGFSRQASQEVVIAAVQPELM